MQLMGVTMTYLLGCGGQFYQITPLSHDSLSCLQSALDSYQAFIAAACFHCPFLEGFAFHVDKNDLLGIVIIKGTFRNAQ